MPQTAPPASPAAHAAVNHIGAAPDVVALVAEALEHDRAGRVPDAVATLGRIELDDETAGRLRRRLGHFHLQTLAGDPSADQAGREKFTAALTSLAALVGAIASMRVRVGNRGYSTEYQGVWVTRVVIAACCPCCGGPRGAQYAGRIVEDGEYLYVDNWDNPCGHQDSFGEVLVEAGVHPPRPSTSDAGGAR